MKLNKRKCRKFADLGLKMQHGNGILHAKQIGYIVRTAIKIIDHHRILILYVYPREQVLRGDFQPVLTIFQNHDDYITLARKEDGSTAWRKAAFDCLDNGWGFTKKCAFYSEQDEMRVRKYFSDDTCSGFKLLSRIQSNIQARRRKERQLIREKQTISRMSCLTTLPRGLKGWIHRSVMPAYFFYDYKPGGKNVPGVCSCCGKEIVLSDVKQGVKQICPHCHKELVCKPRSRRSKYMYDRYTAQVIQGTGDGDLVVRIIKIYYRYKDTDVPKIEIYENARHFVHQDSDSKKVCCDSYYDSYDGLLTTWKKGDRPTFSPWQYNFEADTCGHVYIKNLPNALTGTPWQYCPIAAFYEHFHEPMQILPFLFAHMEHPRMEHLVKTGFYAIVADLAYSCRDDCLDETQHRTHRILGVAAEDVDFLRKMDADLSTLKTFQEYAGLKGRQELLLWQLELKVSRDILPILQYMTTHKMIRYLTRQYSFLCLRQTSYGRKRYENMQSLVSEYRDYLAMCRDLGYDMKNSFVLYPKDLQKSHDRVAKRYKQKENAIIKKKFVDAYRQIVGQMDYEKDGLKIVCPSTPDDLIAEGNALHHCVGSYANRVANRECIILFLRQCSQPDQPYYTIEVRGQKAAQVRGMGNCDMTQEIRGFIAEWEKRVLSRIDIAA